MAPSAWEAATTRNRDHGGYIIHEEPTVCREAWSAETMLRRRRFMSAAPSTACEVLGPSHPLAHASWRASQAVERVRGATIFSAAGTTFLVAVRLSAAPSFAFAGAVVTVAAGLAAVAAGAALRAAATDAIAMGDDHVGVRELDVTRRRLTSPRFRAQLARTLEAYAQTPAPGNRRVWEPILARKPSSDAREAMSAVGALLRSEPAPSPRVIARCSRLVTAGDTSPLFGADSSALDCELRCIRYYAASSGREGAPQEAPKPEEGKASRSHAE